MLAHFHGQTWNAADSARALGVNPSTVRRYPGGKRYLLSEQVEAVPLRDLANPGGLFGEG